MKKKRYYYKFWLKSSRGTDEMTIRIYNELQTEDDLKEDCENWCKCFGAWSASENVCSYGWQLLKNLPKGRKECLIKYAKACKMKNKWYNEWLFYAELLSHTPFNGYGLENKEKV